MNVIEDYADVLPENLRRTWAHAAECARRVGGLLMGQRHARASTPGPPEEQSGHRGHFPNELGRSMKILYHRGHRQTAIATVTTCTGKTNELENHPQRP